MEKLEQILNVPRQKSGEQKIYLIADLNSLSVSVLYSGEGSEEYEKYVDERARDDDHDPYGKHINYEVLLNLQGSKEGRQIILSNTHITTGS